jgi:UTP--glucose-1-phosphate uridylyltransferase
MGRYVLRPEIFEILENQKPGAGEEIQLTDAIKTLNQMQMVVGYEFGFVRATVEFALEREELKDQVVKYLECLFAVEKVEN